MMPMLRVALVAAARPGQPTSGTDRRLAGCPADGAAPRQGAAPRPAPRAGLRPRDAAPPIETLAGAAALVEQEGERLDQRRDARAPAAGAGGARATRRCRPARSRARTAPAPPSCGWSATTPQHHFARCARVRACGPYERLGAEHLDRASRLKSARPRSREQRARALEDGLAGALGLRRRVDADDGQLPAAAKAVQRGRRHLVACAVGARPRAPLHAHAVGRRPARCVTSRKSQVTSGSR